MNHTKTKTILAASAAVSALMSGVASAAPVGTVTATQTGKAVSHLTTPSGGSAIVTAALLSASGSGSLDSTAGLSLTMTSVEVVAGFSNATFTGSDTITGTYSGTTFVATKGVEVYNTCASSTASVCGGAGFTSATSHVTHTYTAFGGTVTVAAGGTLTGSFFSGGYTEKDTYVISKVTSTSPTVPLPPAVMLLGSGLLGLVGTARRRRKA